MRLAKVIGQVVATVRSEQLSMDKLVLLKFVDQDGKEESEVFVAVDKLGAGEDEWVLVVAGSSARLSIDSRGLVPVDLSVVGIIDEVTSGQSSWFKKGHQR